MTQTVPTTQASRSTTTWCVLRSFVARRGSDARGTAPEVAWLPLEGHAYGSRAEAVRAATALFAEPPTEHALAELRRVVRVGEREPGALTFEVALDAREAAREVERKAKTVRAHAQNRRAA
jgi:hypothetical protein